MYDARLSDYCAFCLCRVLSLGSECVYLSSESTLKLVWIDLQSLLETK